MAILTDNTKIAKVNAAFGEIVAEYIRDDDIKTSRRVMEALDGLSPASKVRLFDILTKP